MSWRNITVSEMLGRSGGPPRPAARATPFAEYVMEALRTISRIAALSVTVLLLALPLVTAVPAMAAASRLLSKAAHGQASGLWRELLLDVRRTVPVAWPIGFTGAAGVLLSLLNLAFLAGQPSLIAGVLYAVNVSAVLLGLWWTAACVHELADDPTVNRPQLVKLASRRATQFSLWHLAVLLGAGVAVALLLFVPLVGVLFGPGLAIYLGQVARPQRRTRPQR